MKSLRRVGLLSSLLIVGVMGVLMAPLPSEAATTLTLQVDSGTPVSILGSAVTCADTVNFKNCFAVGSLVDAVGNNSRHYQVKAAPNAQPRLNIGPSRAKLTGVTFYPTSTAWGCTNAAAGSKQCAIRDENHSLKIVMTNQFNAGNLTTFSIGLRSGGNTTAGPSSTSNCGLTSTGLPALCNSQYNFVSLGGTGKFDTTTNPPVPLTGINSANVAVLKVQNSGTSGVMSWTTQLDQTSTYPTFACKTGTDSTGKTLCQPTITMNYIASLYGPDTVTLNDSNDEIGGGCNQTNNEGGTLTPQGPPCFSSSKKTKSIDDIITATFTTDTTNDQAADDDAGAVLATQCTDADHCPCADPDTCKGTIVIEMVETPAMTGLVFPFVGSGPGINDPGCQVTSTSFIPNTFCVGPTNSKGVARTSLGNLPTVGSGPWSFTADIADFPPIPNFNGQWKVDSISCVSQLNIPATYDANGVLVTPPVIFSAWTTDSGSVKLNATVTLLGGGDTVTCSYHAHKNNS
jgi:hypothetical protein